MRPKRIGKLALEDGSVWTGEAFGAEGEAEGELCFETAMCGYQETLTDPNHAGQIVIMTYPEIGNYGVNSDDSESRKIHLSSLIVRNLSSCASNFRSEATLEEYMLRFNKVGLMGLDTRALVRRIRNRGEMNAIVSTLDEDDASLVQKARNFPGIAGQNLAGKAAQETAFDWDEPLGGWADYRLQLGATIPDTVTDRSPLIVVLDFGLRWSMARLLRSLGFRVRIMPGCTSSADEVFAQKPAGVMISNGPGDPAALPNALATIRDLLGKVPVMGICLGNLLLGLACGAKTQKLKFGHRGAGLAIRNESTGKVAITSQNHGFTLDPASIGESLEITHRNINDDTIAGIRHKKCPAFGVMFFPKLTDIVVNGKINADDSHPFVAFRNMIFA